MLTVSKSCKPWWEFPETDYNFWEVRMKIRQIIDDMRIPFDSGVNVLDVYHEMIAYCKAQKHTPRYYSWAVTNKGMLTVDGKQLARVAPLEKGGHAGNWAEADYWEGRILERQEAWMD